MMENEDFVMVDRHGDGQLDSNDSNEPQVTPEDIEDIRAWLSPTEFESEGSDYQKHIHAHAPATGDWLFETVQYKNWHDSESGALWIQGIPGSGKSVITANVIQYLKKQNTPVLFFFSRRIIKSNSEPRHLLRDCLYQYLDHSIPLQVRLMKIMEQNSNIENVMFLTLWKAFVSAISASSKVYLIFDALDELAVEQDNFLQCLLDLGQKWSKCVKLLLTSRPMSHLQKSLDSPAIVSLRLAGRMVEQDIGTYISYRLATSPGRVLTIEDQVAIKDALCQKGQGLFLYTRLMLDEVLQRSTPVFELLQQLPSSLEDTYVDLLSEHSTRSGASLHFQTLLLSWITHASRPLRVIEIATLFQSDMDYSELSRPQDTKLMIRTACGPLLEVLENETVQVIHHSFTEFLLDCNRTSASDPKVVARDTKWFPALQPARIHRSLTLSCIDYLMSGCFESWEVINWEQEEGSCVGSENQKPLMVRFHFLQYASQNLLYHASKCDSLDQHLLSKYNSFFRYGDHNFESFKDFLFSKSQKGKPENFLPIHMAAQSGMTAYTAHLLGDGEDPDLLDSEKRTAVAYAAMHDHTDVLRILLDYKCSISLADHEGLAPIHFAAIGDHAEVLQCLLDAGVDPMTPKSAQNKLHYSSLPSTIGKVPLHYACELGNQAAVSKLLSCLDPSSRRSILPHWAAATGQAKVLSHILQYPEILANINKKNDMGNTPLFLAARIEDSATTRVLLDHGADVTARSDDIIRSPYHDERIPAHGEIGKTALQGWASYRPSYSDSHVRNHEEWVKVGAQLLEAGSDPEARNQEGETVIFAWREQFVDRRNKGPDRAAIFISLLLKHGANPCAISNSGNTVLHEPCTWNAKAKTIALLTQVGADINKARPGDLITPIISAAKTQSVQIANSYGENLADFNAQDADGNTALHWISKSWLLEKNHIEDWLKFADPSIKNNQGETCLYNMRFGNDGNGRVNSIPLLVEKGLDLESRNRRGRTALLAACQNGETEFIKGLLKYGADARSRDFQGKSCLHMAARTEMFNIDGGERDLASTTYLWKALINAGADINGVDFSGNTPFHEAAGSDGNYRSVKARFESILKLGGIATMLNNHGQTALHKVVSLHEKDPTNFPREVCERLEFLLQPSLGIDLHARDNQGLMAIHLAAMTSEAPTWKLAQAGADLQAQSNDGHNSLHLAAKAGRSNVVGLLCKLYKDNAWPIDQSDERGRTPLHYAALSGVSESVYYLLQSGANPNSKDRNGSTPLHMAAEHQIDAVRLRKQRDDKPQPSYVDTHHGMVKLAPYMGDKRKGRRKPQQKENQNLSLGILQEEEAFMIRDVVRQLLSAGADPGVRDASRYTALDVSVALGNEDAVTELLPHMAERDHLQNPIAEYWSISRDKRAGEFVSHLKLNKADAFTLIETAVRFKSDALLDALLKAGVDPKALGPDKLTNIHTIAHRGLTSMMKVVARYVKDLNSFWPPLLHVAASREMSNIQMIDLLIKLGVDVNAHYEEDDHATSRSTGAPIPAYAAAHILAMGEQWWNIAALESLCHAGADFELMDADGNTVVQCALNGSKCGSWGPGFWRDETLDVLLKHDVNLNRISPDSGLTPLMAALQSNRGVKMIQMLLDSGADISLGRIPAIFTAIETENADVVAAIISAGADVNTPYWPEKPRNYGTGPPMETPLLAASLNSGFCMRDFKTKAPKEEILNLLLKHGANPLASLEEGSTTVLHTIAHYHGLINPILKSGISLETRDSKARTPLLAACSPKDSSLRATNDESTPQALIHAGVDINATDETGSTALHLAAQSGLARTILLLLEKGASALAKNDEGLTPLYYALNHPYYSEKLSMTKALIKGGAELLYTGPNGESPLHSLAPLLMNMSPASCTGTRELHAGNHGRRNFMTEFTILYQQFVKSGCSIEARDKAGNTLLFPYVKKIKDRCPDYFSIKPPAPADIKKMFDECDIFATNDEGDTLLHVVASRKETEESEEDGDGVFLFNELMARGLDPRKENKKGASALDVAAVCGNTAILELFARHE